MDTNLLISYGLGIALDYVFGDPRRMPHIVRLIGTSIAKTENMLVASLGRNVLTGALLWLILAGAFVGAYSCVAYLLQAINPWLKIIFDALLVFQCVAFKDLVKHVRDVKIALAKDIVTARKRVSWIVGRDTDQMDESDVCRAAIESGSENLNDAVIAPLFWLFLCGPIGILLFRISNTLDAMVGHRTSRHEKIGKVSARIDDILNFIPARFCSILIMRLPDLRYWWSLGSDARKHPSINAGWPEAAMAKTLGVVIGGRMYEKGKLVQTAEMNEGARQPSPGDIERLIHFMGTAYAKMIGLFVFVALLV